MDDNPETWGSILHRVQTVLQGSLLFACRLDWLLCTGLLNMVDIVLVTGMIEGLKETSVSLSSGSAINTTWT
jgi:hypothetical protein